MAASYFGRGMNEPATFELFVRALPPQRNFLIACGLEEAVAYLEQLAFDREAIAYLESLSLFEVAFLEFLRGLRFRGEAWAIAEGEAVFAGEPLLQVRAPLIEAEI